MKNTTQEHEKPKDEKVNHEVLDWLKEKIELHLKMFDESKHWTKPLEEALKKLVLQEPACSKIFIWL